MIINGKYCLFNVTIQKQLELTIILVLVFVYVKFRVQRTQKSFI